MVKSVVIIGALGKDFHTFNLCFRDKAEYKVLAFTFAEEQNLGTASEKEKSQLKYPSELAGKLYPNGVPMIPEAELEAFLKTSQVDEVVFAYSDVSHQNLMHKACRAQAGGADFRLISPVHTQIQSTVPLIAVCATRTGCGKSQVSRAACRWFKDKGMRVVAIREPMPYGDLIKQKCMRFAKYEDFETFKSTLEEREEYEPYIEQGLVVYSGVDYETIVREAEKEADVIIWDGGNNEVSFYKPDLLLCVCDPLRPGDELKYFPGEVNVRSADAFIINKVNSAKDEDVQTVTQILKTVNPTAIIMHTNSEVSCSDEHKALIKGKRCVVVEDGPTVTHGNMTFGAGFVAVQSFGGMVVPILKEALKGSMLETFDKFPHLKDIIPAMGYTEAQRRDLVDTLNAIPEADTIVNGSPLDLQRLLPGLQRPVARISYDITPSKYGGTTLDDQLIAFMGTFMAKEGVAKIGEGVAKVMAPEKAMDTSAEEGVVQGKGSQAKTARTS